MNSLPLTRFEPMTSTTPPSTTPDIDATNCATETSPKKDVQVALILTTINAVHIVYWSLFNAWYIRYIYKPMAPVISDAPSGSMHVLQREFTISVKILASKKNERLV